MGGQIVDATLVPAPKQRNTEEEKAAVKAGRSAKQILLRDKQGSPEGYRCALDGIGRW